MHELSLRYARTRDPEIREALILAHQSLVYYAASRFIGGGETLEDLVQVGNIGLINAIDRYDAARDVRFSTYAMPTIVGEIKRHFRDKTWHIKVPRWLQELSRNATKVQQSLAARLGRAPTIDEIANEINATEDETIEALEIGNFTRVVSLDARLYERDGGNGATLMDVTARSDSAMRDVEAYCDLRRALGQLEEREREVLNLRYFEDLSQSNIARKLDVSQMQVYRVQQRALLRLRAMLADEAVPRGKKRRGTQKSR